MLSLKFRIGTKLGLAAACGVVLVLALTVNQLYADASARKLIADVKRTNTIYRHVLEAEVELRRIAIQNRAIRAADSEKTVEELVKRTKEYAGNGMKALDAILAVATTGPTKDGATRAKALYETYLASSLELAQAENELIALRERQSVEGRDWTGKLEAIVNGPVLAAAPNGADIARGLERGDASFKQARIVSWSRLQRSDEAQTKRMHASFESALKSIAQARGMAADASIRTAIDEIQPMITRYRALVDDLQGAIDKVAAIVKDKTDPVRIKADEDTEALKTYLRGRIAGMEAAQDAEASRALSVALAMSGAILVVLIGSAVFSMTNVARPISRIGNVLLELANGNKAVEIPYTARGDEVGDNARAAQTFRDNLVRMEKIEAEQREAEARSLAERRAVEEREAAQQKAADEKAAGERRIAMQKLAKEFEAAVGNIVDTVSSASSELESAAGILTRTAEATQETAAGVAAASEQASANVQSVASSTDEMTASVNEISRQVQESSRIAADAVKQAQKTDARISDLSQAAGRIGDVVKLITAIAEQTNLLALNATIEAARAGEAGKGFAVVAQEVKALAAQTAKATDEISSQIAGMQTATHESVTAIKEIGGTIGRIAEIASTIAAAVEEQGAATYEIARNVQQAAQGTTQVATHINDVNRGASETGTASSQVLASAQSLARESSHLKAEVDRFLANVRTA